MKFINSNTNQAIWITDVRERKKPVLMIGNGNCFNVVASFSNDRASFEFTEFLKKFLELPEE